MGFNCMMQKFDKFNIKFGTSTYLVFMKELHLDLYVSSKSLIFLFLRLEVRPGLSHLFVKK